VAALGGALGDTLGDTPGGALTGALCCVLNRTPFRTPSRTLSRTFFSHLGTKQANSNATERKPYFRKLTCHHHSARPLI
jgi:hypothetical protein